MVGCLTYFIVESASSATPSQARAMTGLMSAPLRAANLPTVGSVMKKKWF